MTRAGRVDEQDIIGIKFRQALWNRAAVRSPPLAKLVCPRGINYDHGDRGAGSRLDQSAKTDRFSGEIGQCDKFGIDRKKPVLPLGLQAVTGIIDHGNFCTVRLLPKCKKLALEAAHRQIKRDCHIIKAGFSC